MRKSLPNAGILLVAAVIATSSMGAVTTTVVDVPTDGATQRFLYIRPDAPIANIVALPGGDRILGIQNDGTMTGAVTACFPFSLNRQAFADHGFALALVDATSTGYVGRFNDLREVVRYLQARDKVPTWIVGGSSSTLTAAYLAVALPSEDPTGVIFFSPQRLTAADVTPIKRPALVIYHVSDPEAFATPLFNDLTSAPVRERVALTGGSNAGCGYHLFNGVEAAFVAGINGFIDRNNVFAAAPALNFQALWYAAPAESQPGWGVNVAHQGDTLFATWFSYDAAGPMWLVMSNGARVSGNLYRGTLYRTTGPAFNMMPFNPASVNAIEVGSATFDFSDENRGDFSYTVNGVSGTKPIVRQVFGTPVPQCAAGGTPSATNFQDLWWTTPPGSESGWGVNITHQGNILFATWFTYGASGKGRWLVMPNVIRAGTGSFKYSGDIYETAGAPFNAYDASRFTYRIVGTATFEFSAASAGTFTYTLDGVTQSKTITRQLFSTPVTVCQ